MSGDSARADVRRIVIAEDDPAVSSVSARYLERDGFSVEIVTDGLSAVASVLDTRPALLVLDLALPRGSGLEVLRRVRPVLATPIVVISGRSDVDARVRVLDLGADDYLTKPFSPRELVSRVHAVLRRGGTPASRVSAPMLDIDGLQVDLRERVAVRDGAQIELTALEHSLLLHLMRHAGETLSRAQLLANVWDVDWGDEATVTVMVKRLRQKIEPDPAQPRWIQTVWGLGYRFGP